MGRFSYALAEIAVAVAGTFSACELARLAALTRAEVILHPAYTFSYSAAAHIALWGVGFPLALAWLEWRDGIVTSRRSARLALGLIVGGKTANTYELTVLGGIGDYIPAFGFIASLGDLALVAGSLVLVLAVCIKFRRAVRP